MKDFIAQAVQTESKPNPEMGFRLAAMVRPVHAAMGMETEVGELMDQLKKHIFYNKPLDEQNLREEVGDLLWYVALMCDCFNWKIEDVMAAVIRKLRTRYPNKFTEYDAQHRDTVKEMEAFGMPNTAPPDACHTALLAELERMGSNLADFEKFVDDLAKDRANP